VVEGGGGDDDACIGLIERERSNHCCRASGSTAALRSQPHHLHNPHDRQFVPLPSPRQHRHYPTTSTISPQLRAPKLHQLHHPKARRYNYAIL